MEVRFSKDTDISALKYIWKICFGDEDAYIDFYFRRLFCGTNAVVICDRETVIGVVHLLNAKQSDKNVLYGYAIGVLPQYRGKNCCKQMLDFIKAYAKRTESVFALHPANEKLKAFYQKIGLSELYKVKHVDASSYCSDETYALTSITSEEFFTLRKQAFLNPVIWSENMLQYMIDEASLTGGFVKKLTILQNDRFVLGKVYQNTLFIKETSLTDEEVMKVTSFFKHTFNVEKVIYTLPLSSQLKGKTETAILGFGEPNSSVYMNLFLD